MTNTAMDTDLIERFAGQVFGYYSGGLTAYMIDIGHRTGLFEAAAHGPATSAELAGRAGLHERYVREWLGSMTVSAIVTYDPATATFTLPPEHAACLTVSLAENGAGLGTAFGEQKAIELLTEAGFIGITVTPAPGDPMDGVFTATKPAA